MTEAEWLASDDPTPMMQYLRNTDNARKLGLLQCGCVKFLPIAYQTEHVTQCATVAERIADGQLSRDQINALRGRVRYELDGSLWKVERICRLLLSTERMLWETAKQFVALTVQLRVEVVLEKYYEHERHEHRKHQTTAERKQLSCLIRDVFGNPFQPVALDPDWLTSDVLAMSRGMYETRDFSAMPILADALQDAGCEHAGILDHCRDPDGTHVRGCWVVDLVLGKS